MRAVFLFFLFLSAAAHAEWDHLFSDDEDPALFHHVNVISGNLNLCLQDGVVQGAKSIPLFRTYSSSGALERWKYGHGAIDLMLKDLRQSVLIQGGWSFFPHANLLIELGQDIQKTTVFLSEQSGNFLVYSYSHDGENGNIYLKPQISGGQCSGILSARTNPQNNLLYLNMKQGEATLFLPDGGSRLYKGKKIFAIPPSENTPTSHYYRLIRERLPSKHQIHYKYAGEKKHLEYICIGNHAETKTFAWIRFDTCRSKTPFHFKTSTSDGKHFDYQALEFKMRDYLCHIKSTHRPEEVTQYTPGRKGTGARVESLHWNGKMQFKVGYYLPQDKKEEEKYAIKPQKKKYHIDKVSTLEAPLGPNGEIVCIGRFSYDKGSKFTDVRDADGILTRYFHDGEKITQIDTYDAKQALASSTKFVWRDGRLRCKAKLDSQDAVVFAKTFAYDASGNVTDETLWGNLSGNAKERFSLTSDYTLDGAESLHKHFSFDPRFNLPLSEEEEEGPTTRFYYLPETDLLTGKLTYWKDRIIKREFFEYDADHLLVTEIVDDGSSSQPYELMSVSERHVKRYTRDPTTCLPKIVSEFYVDLDTGSEILLKKVALSYSSENRVSEEAVYDAANTHRYTILTEYEQGRVVQKTTPLGKANIYRYDPFGKLLETKEVGSPYKIYTYDAGGRPVRSIERDVSGAEKICTSIYDIKGRLLTQVDARGNETHQTYDVFGHCLSTEFPRAKDEQGEIYTPIARFTYDIQGNLASTTIASGATTQTLYNSLRKPIEIIQADGTKNRHTYNKNGTLSQTIYADDTEVHYTYDLFQRMTSKTMISQSGEILSREIWEYNTFHLLSHTNVRGLTTRYIYDGAGRKIAEEAEERKKTFSYDALGFLERTTEGDVSQVQICDVEGHIIEQWTEEASGRTENWMRFFYDDEGRKERAIRLTSQGEAEDFFAFDGEGRLVRHIDPHGSTTQFNFSEEKNDLGQRVQQKIVVDALGNTTRELCDAMNRPVLLEKRDHHGEMISREELFYDRSGNRAKRVTFVFDKNRMIKQISASWEYDTMGRMIKEVEDEKKSSTITYDVRGRVKTRTLADGTLLSHSYDCIDRLTELKSSDGTVHHLYFYKQGNEPTEIQDLIQNITLLREYNLFGELIQEMSSTGTRYNWEYDERGRTIKFILPDLSSILYKYTGNHLETVERASPGGQSLYNHHYLHFDQNGHVSEEVTIHRAGGIRTTRDLLERPISYTSLWLCHRTEYGPTNLVTKTANSLFGNKTYVHDALNQLEKEGETAHRFDSIGNPIDCILDRCNQISSINSCILKYDDNGNPKERQECDKAIFYTYDALGRLTSITHPQAKRVLYHYDPLSRLQSKEISIYKNGDWQEEAPIYFIYDQEKEIGTMDVKGRVRELKVLGLGIRGEIGAAVAIELQGKTYAPLHDFQGNIIALVSSKGEIVESYEISAFGKEKPSSPPLNPWRFSSKRAEEGLVFFGKRFYDPTLGRWLTPDPTGFIDGPNLYVFVLNNPLSRLDLFGLSSEYSDVRLEVDIADIQFASPTQLVPCRVIVGESSVNWVVSCGYFYKMQYSDEELSTGKVNIFDHFHELFPKEGAVIGVMSIQNGICTSTDQFAGMYQSARNMVHEGTFFIGMHNTSKGFFSDFWRAATELCGKETSTVATTRQFVGAWTDGLHKYNPQLGWLHIAHSEAGLIYRRAYEGLLPEQKERVQQHLYFYSLGSAQPVPKNYASSAINVYSEDDFVTRMFGAVRAHKPEFDIHFIPCRSSSQEKVLRFIDHGFMGKTYQGALDDRIYKLRTDFGFFNGQTR